MDSLIAILDGETDLKNEAFINKLMIEQGHGSKVKAYISTTKSLFLDLPIFTQAETQELENQMNLTTQYDTKYAESKGKNSWEEYHFKDVPLVAVKTLLNKFKNDALGAQDLVLEKIYEKATQNVEAK